MVRRKNEVYYISWDDSTNPEVDLPGDGGITVLAWYNRKSKSYVLSKKRENAIYYALFGPLMLLFEIPLPPPHYLAPLNKLF